MMTAASRASIRALELAGDRLADHRAHRAARNANSNVPI
jgi:hypothetical protein